MKADIKISPIYLFYGAEHFLIEEEIQKLIEVTLSIKERGLSLHLFSGEEHSAQEIVQTALTLPMFSRYRVVLVSHADRIDGKEIKVLLDYIQRPSPTTCLVLHAQTIGPWKLYREEIEKVGKVKEYPRLKGKALVSWVRKRMQEKGKTLSEEAANFLVEVAGDQLRDLENAIEKVFLSGERKRALELSDVEEITSEVKVSTVFDLTDAIGHQHLEKALGILEKTMESRVVLFRKEEEASKKKERKDDPVPLLLSMMAKQYRTIWRVKELASHRHQAEEMAKILGMKVWNVKKLMDQGRRFSESSLRDGILKCHQTDLAIKRGRGPKDLMMEKLVIDLCRPNTLPNTPKDVPSPPASPWRSRGRAGGRG